MSETNPERKNMHPSDSRDRSEYMKAYQKEVRAFRIRNGRCIRCGTKRVQKYRNCIDCRLYIAEWKKRMRVIGKVSGK